MNAPDADQRELEWAVHLVREAGELTLSWFRTALAVDLKGDGSPVTEADRAAETLVRDRLTAELPADAVIGEEHPDTPGSSGRSWIVDPIDGTRAFTRGVSLYSNLLCLVDEHGPLIGVINMPALGETVWAGRGLGCFWNGEPCRVSATTELAEACLTTSGLEVWDASVLAAVRSAGLTVRTWGDGYGYALVATGRADLMVDPEAARWDLAPMPLILREAGGEFSDLAGHDDYSSGSGLASNALLHQAALNLLG